MTRRRVREAAPIQVYLIADERQRLERLAEQLDASKSDVVRRGLLALERELRSPAGHPALRLIGMAPDEMPGVPPADAARDHDHVLAAGEELAWTGPESGPATRRSKQAAKQAAKAPAKRRGR